MRDRWFEAEQGWYLNQCCTPAPRKCPLSRETEYLSHAAGKVWQKHKVTHALGWYPVCCTTDLLYSQHCNWNNFPFPIHLMKMGSCGPVFILQKCCISHGHKVFVTSELRMPLARSCHSESKIDICLYRCYILFWVFSMHVWNGTRKTWNPGNFAANSISP